MNKQDAQRLWHDLSRIEEGVGYEHAGVLTGGPLSSALEKALLGKKPPMKNVTPYQPAESEGERLLRLSTESAGERQRRLEEGASMTGRPFPTSTGFRQ
jgi:hypothetical protein